MYVQDNIGEGLVIYSQDNRDREDKLISGQDKPVYGPSEELVLPPKDFSGQTQLVNKHSVGVGVGVRGEDKRLILENARVLLRGSEDAQKSGAEYSIDIKEGSPDKSPCHGDNVHRRRKLSMEVCFCVE